MDVGCRMRFLMLMLITIKVRSDNSERFYVSNDKINWISARKECQMMEPKDINGTVLHQSMIAWINASISFTPWTLYHGCRTYDTSVILNNFSIPEDDDYLLFCIKQCKNTKYIGLKERKCACLGDNALSKVKHACKSTQCTNDTYALCGIEKYNTSYAIYEIIQLDEPISGFSNCLVANKSFPEDRVTFESLNCEGKKNNTCGHGTESVQDNWMLANVACDSPYTINWYKTKNIDNGIHWTAYSRRSEENYKPVDYPEYCVAAKVGQGGRLSKKIRKCDEKLHVLCKRTDHQSMNTGKPADNLQTTLIIVSVVSTVVLSLIIGIIVCIVRKKRGSTESDGDISSGQQQVYAEVKKISHHVSESQKANDVPSPVPTDPAPSDEVYDHTDHTLRPQVITENNYDTMQNVMADDEDLDNVYNTSNEVVVFNTVVGDSSEYSHVKIV